MHMERLAVALAPSWKLTILGTRDPSPKPYADVSIVILRLVSDKRIKESVARWKKGEKKPCS